jgi:hypothetical protein
LLVYFDRMKRGSIFQGSRRVLEITFPRTSAVKPGLLSVRIGVCRVVKGVYLRWKARALLVPY